MSIPGRPPLRVISNMVQRAFQHGPCINNITITNHIIIVIVSVSVTVIII